MISRNNLGSALITTGIFVGGCGFSLISIGVAKLFYGDKYNNNPIYWKSNIVLALIGGCVCLYLTNKYIMKSHFLL